MPTPACMYCVLLSLHYPVPDLCAAQKLTAGELWAQHITHPLFMFDLAHFWDVGLQGNTDEEDAGPASELV